MAYHLKRGESIPKAVRRIVEEELDPACTALRRRARGDRDEDIHEARKSLKKVRALLRLVRPEPGDVYVEENKRLRNLGRELSQFRDAGAIIEVFDGLKERYPEEWNARQLDPVRRKLAARKKSAEATTAIHESLTTIGASLCAAGQSVKHWPLPSDGFTAIKPGLKTAFRNGRKAFARVLKSPRPDNYHEWRKRVKDHWYHVRLLEHLWTDVMQAYEKSLKDLETWLGDDHNLVLLRETIDAERESFGKKPAIDLLLRLIDKYQKELRANAESIGKRVYDVKPKQFTKQMKQLWYSWQSQPKTLP